MNKLLKLHYLENLEISLSFSNGQGVETVNEY